MYIFFTLNTTKLPRKKKLGVRNQITTQLDGVFLTDRITNNEFYFYLKNTLHPRNVIYPRIVPFRRVGSILNTD